MLLRALLGLLVVGSVQAEPLEHSLMRRIAVFPLEAPEELSNKADDVWWQLRETLAKNKRFLVATKNFLQQQNVYQPRGELAPDAAIILGRLLDSDAIVSTYLRDRVLHMAVYEAKYGRPLWTKEIQLQPSIPLSHQIENATQKLVKDFLASVPYQGFVTVDPLKGTPSYRDDKHLLFRADVGLNSDVEVGDPAELIRIRSDQITPLYTTGAAVEVYGQGRVIAVNHDIITVEVDRITMESDIKERSMVRLPKELRSLQQQFSLQDPLKNKIHPEFLSPDIQPAQSETAEYKPLIASLVFLVNLAAFLAFAF